MSVRDSLIAQAKAMPHLPAPVMRIMNYLSKPDADLNVLATLIEHDPGLTVNVLRMANSSFFCGDGSVASVREALFRLGTKRVVQLVIASGVAPAGRGEVKGYGLAEGELLRASIAVGLGAELVARELDHKAPDHTFTAGLLCNIGKVILGRHMERDPAPVLDLAAREALSFEQAERRLYGIDHAELGAEVLTAWEIPEPIVQCVRWHLDPCAAPSHDLALDLVHVGKVLAIMVGVGQGMDGLQYEVCQESFQRLGMTTEAMYRCMAGLVEGLSEVEGVLAQV